MVLIIIRFLIFASLVLSVYMIVVTLERCRSEKRYSFVYCIVTLILYTLGYFIEISSGTLGGGIIAVKIMYAGGCFMSPFFFFFVADYCEIRLPKKFYRIPLLVIPVLFYLLVITFDHHKLLYSSYSYDPANPILGMTIEPGTLYLIGTFYPLFCIGLSCIVLFRSMLKQSRGRRLGLILLLVSSLAPLIANFSYVALSYFFKTALAGINFTAFIMVISNFIFFYNVVRNDMFDLAPKAYAITLDLIRDAFVVLDRGMAYTLSNKNAQELFPALVQLNKGASILGLENWPPELNTELNNTNLEVSLSEIEFQLPHKPGKIYSGWINRVASESGATLGWVILIQDITETVRLIRNIQSQRDEIAAMRDNLKEGLFLMDSEYRLQPSYSKALEDILSGTNLQGRSFTGLLSRSFKPKDITTIADYFTMIMEKSVEPEMLEEMNPLEEFLYTSTETGVQKTLRCIFAPVDQGGGEIFVMGTIQDISAETALKKQLAEEEARRQDEMRNLFELVQVDQNIFSDFIEDTDDEFNRINTFIQNKKLSNRELLLSLYQLVHAIKSNALIVGLSAYGGKLHELESKIKILREKETEPDFDDILHITVELEKLKNEKEKLEETLNKLRDFNTSGKSGVKKEDEIFTESLKKISEKTAADEQKKVSFAVETLDREALHRGQRKVMKEILTQLVRNAVYHGIEKPEERLSLGKEAEGKITLSVSVENGKICMILSDDGRGLDYDNIARKAQSKGLLKNPETEKNNRQLLSSLIFSPGFSTSETENLHAGRGIGLNLVRDRLLEVKGTIEIKNKKGQGLSFVVKIPLEKNA